MALPLSITHSWSCFSLSHKPRTAALNPPNDPIACTLVKTFSRGSPKGKTTGRTSLYEVSVRETCRSSEIGDSDVKALRKTVDKHTERTSTQLKDLRHDCRRIRRLGYEKGVFAS
ncbi:uncharacterized protein TRIVIDRAFT_69431 [Trichoderma virens Gv29-8]|uniref:Uncharacterized protein n=1 Tax=Hypocrea virens (strain Gv29-8 / FGSC 10586) TaxID=413071 RepID=G9MXX3_HYPVG|nr:uncharacterized protein TRIVIDRAFT_69431 [Trichoderma virens Gv29-8]EHK20734.1 hypothetical protein TRIVIDRAFT_69431 [Trichoderma virens Gv29-8]